MIKIGTLTCLHSNNVCARVGCLKAFQNRSDFFEGYSPDTLLGAMMTCNGCKSANPKEPDVDDVILENNEYYVFKAVGRKEYDLSPAVFLSE